MDGQNLKFALKNRFNEEKSIKDQQLNVKIEDGREAPWKSSKNNSVYVSKTVRNGKLLEEIWNNRKYFKITNIFESMTFI